MESGYDTGSNWQHPAYLHSITINTIQRHKLRIGSDHLVYFVPLDGIYNGIGRTVEGRQTLQVHFLAGIRSLSVLSAVPEDVVSLIRHLKQVDGASNRFMIIIVYAISTCDYKTRVHRGSLQGPHFIGMTVY